MHQPSWVWLTSCKDNSPCHQGLDSNQTAPSSLLILTLYWECNAKSKGFCDNYYNYITQRRKLNGIKKDSPQPIYLGVMGEVQRRWQQGGGVALQKGSPTLSSSQEQHCWWWEGHGRHWRWLVSAKKVQLHVIHPQSMRAYWRTQTGTSLHRLLLH